MSKKWDEERWGPHVHCVVCGNAMPEGKKTCSPECQAKYDKEAERYKKQQRYNYIIIGFMGVSILVFFLILEFLR